VDDVLVMAGIDARGCELLELIAHRDDDVGVVEGEVLVVVAHEAHHTQSIGVGVGQRSLGLEGGRHRKIEGLGESPQLRAGVVTHDAVTGQDDRGLRMAEKVDRLPHLAEVGGGAMPRAAVQRAQIGRGHLGLDVLGHRQVGGSRPLRLSEIEGLAHHLGDGLRTGHRVGPLGDRSEHVRQRDDLMGLLVDPVQPDLGRYRHHGRRVRGGVGGPEQQVDGSRPQGREADPGPAGQAPVDVGHEGGGLLVVDEDEPDVRAVTDRLDDPGVLLTGQSEDHTDALGVQAVGDQIGHGGHVSQLLEGQVQSSGSGPQQLGGPYVGPAGPASQAVLRGVQV
jgi:hypothetical protein